MVNSTRELIIWYSVRKLAKAHPFFRMKGRLLSMREAKRILQGYDIPDGAEVIRQARIELGIPEPIIANVKSNARVRPQISTVLRRAAIVFAVIALLFCFFTMTEVGTTLAESIYKVIVSIFDGSLHAQSDNEEGILAPIDFSVLPSDPQSPEDIAGLIPRPIIVPGSDDTLKSFMMQLTDTGMLIIRSRYAQDDGSEYVIMENIYDDNAKWGYVSSAVDNEVKEVSLPIGIDAYISTMDDGTVYVKAFGAGFDVNISSSEIAIDDIEDITLTLKIAK